MQSLEYIDNYFKGNMKPEETRLFEQRIKDDPAFAEEVAFYCNAMQTIQDELITEKKKRFRDIYRQQGGTAVIRNMPARRWRPAIAIAALLACVIAGWFLFSRAGGGPQQMAGSYIKENLQELDVTMGSVQKGLDLYNSGKLKEAQLYFEQMAAQDPSSEDGAKYAGITALRLKEYDKALTHFRQLEKMPLYTNPSKFYQALTLMQRNQPGDAQQAKQLLQQVVNNNLEGKETAQQWLANW
ncbi:MAG TPA: hypothetical protein VD996_08350 [Chitinophagaceae bacterium]|nr:hypothetical protein [Chitinophagaceae bacterium]